MIPPILFKMAATCEQLADQLVQEGDLSFDDFEVAEELHGRLEGLHAMLHLVAEEEEKAGGGGFTWPNTN